MSVWWYRDGGKQLSHAVWEGVQPCLTARATRERMGSPEFSSKTFMRPRGNRELSCNFLLASRGPMDYSKIHAVEIMDPSSNPRPAWIGPGEASRSTIYLHMDTFKWLGGMRRGSNVDPALLFVHARWAQAQLRTGQSWAHKIVSIKLSCVSDWLCELRYNISLSSRGFTELYHFVKCPCAHIGFLTGQLLAHVNQPRAHLGLLLKTFMH